MTDRLDDIFECSKRLLTCDVAGMNIFDKYSPMYTFTNENIKGLMHNVEFNDKDVLLVCSSGDHIFNVLLQDPRSVVAYDINALTKHMFELKKSAIINLSISEFLNFFFKTNFITFRKCFNKKVYDKIRDTLPLESREYWDYIFDNFDNYQIRSSFLFRDNQCTKNTIRYINPYLKEDNYLKLRDKLNNFELNFINTNISDLSNSLDSKFDYIYLSNIISYFDNSILLSKLKELILKLEGNLKDNGQLGLVYLYNYMDDYYWDCDNLLYNPIKRDKILCGMDFVYNEFPNAVFQKENISVKNVNYQNRDVVLTLKKVNN